MASLPKKKKVQIQIIYIYIPSLKLTQPLKMGLSKRNIVFQSSIFRCYVSFREGIYYVYFNCFPRPAVLLGALLYIFGVLATRRTPCRLCERKSVVWGTRVPITTGQLPEQMDTPMNLSWCMNIPHSRWQDFMVPAEWPFPTKKCIQKHQSYNASTPISNSCKAHPKNRLKPYLGFGKSEHTTIFQRRKTSVLRGGYFLKNTVPKTLKRSPLVGQFYPPCQEWHS